jgi:predicted ferric reductase
VKTLSQPILLGNAKRRQLQRSSEALQLLGAAGVLIPLLALISDGAASNLDSIESVTGFVNRASALVGTSLLLLHLVLVARVPWIEAVFGLDKLTAAHKKLGKPLVYILGLHVATSIFFYSQQNNEDIFSAAVDLVGGYFEMFIAAAGFALMLIVTVSSINAARRMFSYEVWYLIHLLSYIAVFLAIPHQFAFGSTFLAQPWLTTYFGALYLFVLLNVVWFRSLHPVVRAFAGGFRVSSVKPAGNNSTSISVHGKGLAKLKFKSGQFFMVRVMTLRDFWKPHPFSASNSSGEGFLRFTIGNRGDFTARMQSIPLKTRIVLEGPYGVFTEAKRSKQKVTLIAAGIGVAPIRSLAQQLAAKPGDLTIVYRANTEQDAALADELVQISQKRGHKLKILTGPRDKHVAWLPEQGAKGKGKADYVLLSELVPDILESDIYICGPSQWTNSLVNTVSKLSIPEHQIHIEEFAW